GSVPAPAGAPCCSAPLIARSIPVRPGARTGRLPLYGFRAPSIEVPVLRRSTGTGGAGPRSVLGGAVRGGPAGLSGAGLPRLGVPVGELDRGGLLPLGEQVEHLDQEREAHGGVDVALGHVEAEAVGDQGDRKSVV